MQPIDALTLHHLAGELDLKLADGKINKVQQASHYEVLLHFWVGGEAGRQKLYINIRPEYAYCALMTDTGFLSFPEQAPNFCMLLRKHLLSARVKKVATLPDERVLNLHFDNYNELGQQVHLVLSIELMGKNSNIILYDEELNLILGCAHGVSEEMSRVREISVGYPYAPPPRPSREAMRFVLREVLVAQIEAARQAREDPAHVLTQTYAGVGKATLKDIFDNIGDAGQAYDALQDLFQGNRLFPAIRQDFSRYSLLGIHQSQPEWLPIGSVNRMIQHFYTTHLLADRLKAMRKQLRQVVKAQEKKLAKRRQELEKTEPEQTGQLKKMGDLLTVAASQNLQTSGSRIQLPDLETGELLEIELDPTLSLTENAQLYYRRFKKTRSRQRKAVEDTQQLDNMLQFIREIYSEIDLAQSEAELLSVREDLEAQGWMKPVETRKKGPKKEQSQPLSVTSSDGFTILIGKNSLQNELIVGKLSHPEDLWLHAHLIPGSHVLVKANKQEIPDATLLEAAVLAAYFSQARASVNVPIVYTRARYVRKIPNSYPGHVNYTMEKSVNVTPTPDVVMPLLQPGGA